MTPSRHRYYIDGTFVVETRPAGPTHPTAVLILPPMGWEDTCAHRPLRTLAGHLADAGHVVLHLDWPGLGDSAGDAGEPALVNAWVAAVTGAAAELRARGFEKVAGVAVRPGALVALAAEGIDELVLWATPATGKAYLREERALAKMAIHGDPPADAAVVPEGAVEAAGFFYSAETVKDLEALVATTLAGARPRGRVLLLDRDGGTPSPKLVAALEGAGARVTVSAAVGLGDLLERPYKCFLNDAVRDAIVGWMGGERRASGCNRTEGVGIGMEGPGWSESPWVSPPAGFSAASPGPGRRPSGGSEPPNCPELSGILCRPRQEKANMAWVVFFNAGGMRRSGPNRLWTRAARELAACGVGSLRFDVRDVGDSDGTTGTNRDLDGMYSEASVGDALRAFDWLRGEVSGPIDVVGLCSGGFLGAQVAAVRQVRRAVLFNTLAFVWDEEARASDMTSEIGRSLFDARRWGRLLTGRIDARALATSILGKARAKARQGADRLRGRPPLNEVAALLQRVMDQGTDLRLVCSAGDPSIDYLLKHAPEQRARLTTLEGVDHTIRPVWAHARVVELVMEGACPRPG